MIIVTLRDIIGLILLGLIVMPLVLLMLWIYIKNVFTAVRLKKQGFSRVDKSCEYILHCGAYDTGFCTRLNGEECQFHPKYKEQSK